MHKPPPRQPSCCCLPLKLLLTVFASIIAHISQASVFHWQSGPLADALPDSGGSIQSFQADGFSIVVDGTELRPGDRFKEILLIADDTHSTENRKWQAELYDLRQNTPLASTRQPLIAQRMILDVDLRAWAAERFRLRIELIQDDQSRDVVELPLETLGPQNPPTTGERIPIRIDWPETRGKPSLTGISFGMPFAPGVLWQENGVRIVDKNGVEQPSQLETTATWGREGSIRWLRVDTLADSASELFVEFNSGASPTPADAVRLITHDDGLTVRTGEFEYLIGPGPSPIRRILHEGQILADAEASRGLYLIDNHGRTAMAAEDTTMEVEATGPVQASIRFEGYYRTASGQNVARHITRLEFYAGESGARITHTLILTEDTRELWFDEVGWELAVNPGSDSRAVFAVSADDPWRNMAISLNESTPAAAILQEDYVQYGGGKKQFSLYTLDDSSAVLQQLADGEAMGDWAALTGSDGGLMVSCRDAARQHPKEFEIHGDRIVIKLFSPRAEHSLDMRPQALVERWNRGGRINEKAAAELAAVNTTAIGWAKTHHLLIQPLPADSSTELMADISRLHSQQVYALIDPQWIYRSQVFGPLHPYDPGRFPEAEEMMRAAMADYLERAYERDEEYGFVDYFAGPHYRRALGNPRFSIAYATRMAGWLQYARSGHRDLRRYAEGTNRVYGDSYMNHWSAENRIAGLYAGSSDLFARYPFYWGTRPNPAGGGGPNSINQFLWDYYLTGYRRAEDIALAYGEGMKEWWQPGISVWYRLKVLRNLWLLYAHTWDPELRIQIEDFMDAVYDPEGELAIHQDAIPNSTTYKLEEDTLGVIQAWELLGDSRYLDLATRMSRYTWEQSVGMNPLNSRFDKGRVGNFLYQQSNDPGIATEMFRALREGSAGNPVTGISHQNFRLIGMPYAQSLIAQTDADRNLPASWAAFEAFGYPASIIVGKSETESLNLIANSGDISIQTIGEMRPSLLHSIHSRRGVNRITLPRDSHEGAYRIDPRSTEALSVVADRRAPMVVYAPEYWRPMTLRQNPAIPVYFKVPPEGDGQPAIFFEGPAKLYTPQGECFGDGETVQGWVELPRGTHGLWYFQTNHNFMLKVLNLPPFFAFDDPAFYFEPDIDWADGLPLPTKNTTSRTSGFVSVDTPEGTIQALYLSKEDSLSLEAGPARSDQQGGQFLPAAEGTIEFHLKPDWSTFDLFPAGDVNIISLPCDDGRKWHLNYTVNTDPRGWPVEWRSHVFDAELWCPEGRLVTLRRTILERDQWVHVALVWKPSVRVTRRGAQEHFRVLLFVNGELGSYWTLPNPRTAPEHFPLSMVFGKSLAGTVANLRISGNARYGKDFRPPPLMTPFQTDPYTRALFNLDGNLNGSSYGWDRPLRLNATF